MGGKCFSELLPNATFPRMSPQVYQSLKDRILPHLSSLFTHVAVPYEAPGKVDYGDLDIVVAVPKTGETVLHEQIKDALGSTLTIPFEGYRTSNYAVPIPADDLALMQTGKSDAKDVYYQIDVRICENKADLDRYVYCRSYGDLGMLLGVITRSVGLGFSAHGLKLAQPKASIPDPPHLLLTSSFPDLFDFLSLSIETWNRGFTSQFQIFDWLMTCRFFDPSRILAIFDQKQKARSDRTMFYAFPDYVRSVHGDSKVRTARNLVAIQEEALARFGKREEFEAIVHEKMVLRKIKDQFNGNLVMEWTGIKSWRLVKRVMDTVRASVGGDDWKEVIAGMSVEEVKSVTMEVKEGVLAEELEQGVAGLKVGDSDTQSD